jgi:hypothetical protein
MTLKVTSRGFAASTRYEVEWVTDKPGINKTEIDFDRDTDAVTNVKYFTTKREAMAYARLIFKSTDLTWGHVTVTKQIHELEYPEYNIYEWNNTDESWEVA